MIMELKALCKFENERQVISEAQNIIFYLAPPVLFFLFLQSNFNYIRKLKNEMLKIAFF
jgi:hypothetical protein